VKRVLQRINEAFHDLMKNNKDVLFIGEDVLDPYGGAFKVSKGLSVRFPDQVITTPISEATIVGLGTGLALEGFRPVIEIMFGDFTTLIVDQLLNQATKMTWMYGEQLNVPLVVRTPMGGHRGYGPTHSQSLEKLFLGIPNLRVLAHSRVYDPYLLTQIAVNDIHEPVLLIENKMLYTRFLGVPNEFGFQVSENSSQIPTVRISNNDADITFITYGDSVELVLNAMKYLRDEEELLTECYVVHQLSPLDINPLLEAVVKTRRIVIVEEGTIEAGWGAEVIASLSEIALEAPPERVASKMLPIPAARSMEKLILPQKDDVIEAAIRTVDRRMI
jgi:pyruvate/2-oxoglutarate/acetoin dehydrogenase E1 component